MPVTEIKLQLRWDNTAGGYRLCGLRSPPCLSLQALEAVRAVRRSLAASRALDAVQGLLRGGAALTSRDMARKSRPFRDLKPMERAALLYRMEGAGLVQSHEEGEVLRFTGARCAKAD